MITVFGSMNIDLLMAVPSLPAPGETVLCPTYELKPGGKGCNQAVAAARAGAKVAMVGMVGQDGFGDRVLRTLEREGIDTTHIGRAPQPTACAIIAVDPKGENQIAVGSGANLAARADSAPDARLGPGQTLLLQMEVTPAETWAILARARAGGCRTILNLAPAGPVPDSALPLIDILIVNEIEAAQLAGGAGEPQALAESLRARTGGTVIVTLGAAGVLAATPGGIVTIPALKIEPVDTTGAGDAFCGILAAALDAGIDLPFALRRASAGAALACLALGAQESLPDKAAIDAAVAKLGA